MPTTNAVLNRIKGPLGSFLRSSSRGFTLIASRKTETKNEGAKSKSVLRFDNCSYQANILPRDKALPTWSDSGNDSGDWLRDQESVATYPLDHIRKTTDIEVA